MWCFQNKLVLGSYLMKLKNLEQEWSQNLHLLEQTVPKILTQQTGASPFSQNRCDILLLFIA